MVYGPLQSVFSILTISACFRVKTHGVVRRSAEAATDLETYLVPNWTQLSEEY